MSNYNEKKKVSREGVEKFQYSFKTSRICQDILKPYLECECMRVNLMQI